MKKRLLLVALVLQTTLTFGQISIYFCERAHKIGYSTGWDNTNGARDSKALQNCYDNGGQSPVRRVSHNGPGCYAIVTGRNKDGGTVYGWSGGGDATKENAINAAKQQAYFYGATDGSISVMISGCGDGPPAPKQTTTTTTKAPPPQWSEWRSQACANLSYRNKTLEGYDWNYQVHMYFEVVSNFKVPVSFVFGLYDKNGKMHFGDVHTLQPGQKAEFVHKMSGKIIESIRVTDVTNLKTNRKISCDDDGTPKPGESERELMLEINGYAVKIPDTDDRKKYYLNFLASTQKNRSLSEEKYIEGLKDVRDGLKGLHETYSQNQRMAATANEQMARKIEADNKVIEEKRLADELRKRDEAEALERKKADEHAAFRQKIQQGDAAMSARNYPSAMSYYQAAQNGTTDANDKSLAASKYNAALEAKKTADRAVRVEEAKERDKDENIAYTSMATATAGVMAFLKDGYSSKGFAGKFSVGLGYEHSPILSNSTGPSTTSKSYIEERNLLTVHMGLTLGVLNNKPVSVYFKPEANMGMSALQSGINGGFFSYGGSAVLQLGVKKHSKFNIFGEGGWLRYSGTFKYDADAQNSAATDDVREGNMSFSKLRYGGGFMLRWIDADLGKETYVRPGVFFEKPSFFTSAVKPVLSMNLQANIYSAIILDFTYTPNTFIPGELHHPTTLERKDVNYFSIKIIRQGRLN